MADAWFIQRPVWLVRPVRGLYRPTLTLTLNNPNLRSPLIFTRTRSKIRRSACPHIRILPVASAKIDRVTAKVGWERLHFRSSGSYYSHFLTENETENASFFDASIFDPIFQSESEKLSRNLKPCLRYNLTGIWFYCVSNTVLLHSVI